MTWVILVAEEFRLGTALTCSPGVFSPIRTGGRGVHVDSLSVHVWDFDVWDFDIMEGEVTVSWAFRKRSRRSVKSRHLARAAPAAGRS